MRLSLFLLTGCLPPILVDTGLPLASDSGALDSADSAESVDSADTSDTVDTADTGDTNDTSEGIDADSDGHVAASDGGDDCNDSDPNIYPAAPEYFDAVDDDCDTMVSETVINYVHATNTPGAVVGTAVFFARGLDDALNEVISVGLPGAGSAMIVAEDDLRTGTADEGSILVSMTTADTSANVGYSHLLADLDGDGLLDWMVGAPGTRSGDGALYVVEDDAVTLSEHIDLDGLAPVALHSIVADGVLGSPAIGTAVATLEGNIAVSTLGLTGGGAWLHDVDTVLGATETVVSEGQRIAGDPADLNLGAAMISADFSCDGTPGLLISAPSAVGGAVNAGRIYGFLADTINTGANLTTAQADLEITGGIKDAYLGGFMLSASDINDDGCSDYAVMSYAVSGKDRTVAVLRGAAAIHNIDASSQALALIDEIKQYDASNIPSAAIVDVDGDLRSDLLVGEPEKQPGEVHLFMSDVLAGGGTLGAESATVTATGPEARDLFGAGMIGIDDGGHDGLLLSAPNFDDGAIFYVPTR